jgi:hypothetical protein
MANILPEAVTQFVDGNGKPYAGGSVYFYIPNTTTFKAIWKDAAQTISQTNPVVLDGDGRAVIFGSGAYRQQLYDVNNNLIWDQLTYSPVGSTDLGSTSVPGGAGLIGFDGNTLDQQFKSRVERVCTSIAALRAIAKTTYNFAFVEGYYTPGDGGGGAYWYDSSDTTSADNGGTIIVAADGGRWKLVFADSVSLKQFGAKFDGVTADTAAINNALASTVKNIIAPPGTCITAGSHTITTGKFLIGAGEGTTIFSCSATTGDVFTLNGSNSGISKLTVTGSASRTAGRMIYISAGQGPVYVREIGISNYFVAIECNGTGHFLDGIIINDTTQPSSPLSYAIYISGGNDHFINNVISNNLVGFENAAGLAVTQSEGSWITNCDFIHSQNGVLIAPSGSGFVRFMFFEDVACDTASNNGWYFLTAGTARITSCSFTNCWAASAVNQGILTQGNGGEINGLNWVNTRVVNCGLDGVYYQNNVKNITMNGGQIAGNSQTVPASSYGVHVGPNLTDFVFNGLRIGPSGDFPDTQVAQIRVDAGTGNRISVVGCDLNTSHTAIDSLASGTNNVISGCTGPTLTGFVSATTDSNGHITVTHNTGTSPKSIIATVQNDSAAVFVQYSGTATTTNFQLKFFNSSGASLNNTAVSFSWRIDF